MESLPGPLRATVSSLKVISLRQYKRFLTLVGEQLSARALYNLKIALNYALLGRWVKDNGFEVPSRRVVHRNDLFDLIASKVSNKKTLYLEFGVYKGVSIQYWSHLLEHPDAVLHGFDSFMGLPEHFDPRVGLMRYSLNADGKAPIIDDPRVTFFKGWFEDVLPTYEVPSHEQLVIMIDCDLYSSTLYALRHLREYIKPGSYLYFDDMSQPEHEPRAFSDFVKESGLRFNLVWADHTLNNCVFECSE